MLLIFIRGVDWWLNLDAIDNLYLLIKSRGRFAGSVALEKAKGTGSTYPWPKGHFLFARQFRPFSYRQMCETISVKHSKTNRLFSSFFDLSQIKWDSAFLSVLVCLKRDWCGVEPSAFIQLAPSSKQIESKIRFSCWTHSSLTFLMAIRSGQAGWVLGYLTTQSVIKIELSTHWMRKREALAQENKIFSVRNLSKWS